MTIVRFAACALAITVVSVASPGWAQDNAFVAAVREFGRSANAGGRDTRATVDRMEAALAEWDRQLSDLEKRVRGDLLRASRDGAFKLHVELGLAYGRRGRTSDALREFDAAAALRPTASDVHVLRGLTFEAAGQPDEAARAFHTAWERDRQHPVKAYYALRDSNGSESNGPRQTLIEAYQQIVTKTVEPRGALFVPMGAVNEMLWQTPLVGDAELADGFARLAAGEYPQAIEAFRRPAANGANSPLAQFTSAGRLEAEGRIPEARRAYELALAGTVSGRSRIYLAIGRLAQADGDLPGAIDAFERAVRVNSNDGAIHRELALALAGDGRSDDAFMELVAALLINPGDAAAMAAIGQLFLDTGRYAEAATALRRTLQLAPNRFETHYALASALTQLGDTNGAAAALEQYERSRQAYVERRRQELNEAVEQGDASPVHPDALRKER